MKYFTKNCPQIANVLFAHAKSKSRIFMSIFKRLSLLILVTFLAVSTITANYILGKYQASNSEDIVVLSWVGLAFTLVTYVYFLIYMIRINNNIQFFQSVHLDIGVIPSTKKSKKNIIKTLVRKDDKNLVGYYFNHYELFWMFAYFIIYMFWIFWAATYIAKVSKILNFDQNTSGVLNFLINSIGLGVVSTGIGKILKEYSSDKKFYFKWLTETKMIYDDLFNDLQIVNETKFYNKKFDYKFTNDFVKFFNDERVYCEWNKKLLKTYQALWIEYWEFFNDSKNLSFLEKGQNTNILRVVNSFFANFLNMNSD